MRLCCSLLDFTRQRWSCCCCCCCCNYMLLEAFDFQCAYTRYLLLATILRVIFSLCIIFLCLLLNSRPIVLLCVFCLFASFSSQFEVSYRTKFWIGVINVVFVADWNFKTTSLFFLLCSLALSRLCVCVCVVYRDTTNFAGILHFTRATCKFFLLTLIEIYIK